MPALLYVAFGAAEPVDQKASKPLLGGSQVPALIHRPQNLVIRNLPIERGYKMSETLLADGRIHFVLFHEVDASIGTLWML